MSTNCSAVAAMIALKVRGQKRHEKNKEDVQSLTLQQETELL